MPLFGRHKNNTESNAMGHNNFATGTGHNSGNTAHPGNHNVSAMGTGPHGQNPDGNMGGYSQNGTAYQHAGTRTHQPGMTNLPPHGQTDPYSNTIGNNEIPPVNHLSSGHRSGGGSSMAGKMEHAIGTLVGSQALKAKGLEKEREAQAYKAQSAELAEAERLEQEANVRRDRATAYGAHPSIAHNAARAPEFGDNFGQSGMQGGGLMNGPGVVPTTRGGAL